jgi:hypothetical protein
VEQVLVGLNLTGLRAVVDDLDALAGRETYLGRVHASIRDGKHRRCDVSPVSASSIAPSARRQLTGKGRNERSDAVEFLLCLGRSVG